MRKQKTITLPEWNAREARTLARVRSMDIFARYTYFLRSRDAIRTRGDAYMDVANGINATSDDPILRRYRFTNIRRSWDFTSRWLHEHWYTPMNQWRYPFIGRMCALARWINHVPSLEAIGLPEGGRSDDEWRAYIAHVYATLLQRRAEGHKIWTSAYFIIGGIPTGADKLDYVLHHILGNVWYDKGNPLDEEWNRLDDAHTELRTYDSWGDFMSQEVTLDLAETWRAADAADRSTYTHLGPGAIRGLNRFRAVANIHARIPRAEALAWMQHLYTRLKRSTEVPRAWQRDLTWHDVEFTLCEFDKYERVLHGEGVPKQLYTPRVAIQRSFFSPDDRPAVGDLEA